MLEMAMSLIQGVLGLPGKAKDKIVKDIVFGIVRHGLTTLGGALLAHGLVNAGQLNDGVGSLMVILGLGWSLWEKRAGLSLSLLKG